MSAVRFDRIAPVIPVRDLRATLARYQRLGFDVREYDGPDRYGFADRGSVSLHITEWAEHDPLRTAAAVYIYVDDADGLHTQWQSLELDGRLTDPEDTAYGLREFAFVDCEGTLHRIGSPLKR